MDYSKFTVRELRVLLSTTADTASKAEIEKALASLTKAFASNGKLIRPKSESKFGMVKYTRTTQGGNTTVGIIVKGGDTIVSELTPKQMTASGLSQDHPFFEEGDIVSVQLETRVKGVTQYKNENGDIHFHGQDIDDAEMPVGTSYIAVGLVSLSSEKALKNYMLLNS